VLNGTQIKGNVQVATGAALNARQIKVNGNIQAEGAKAISVTANSQVNGNIQIKLSGPTTVTNGIIKGDLQLEENTGALLLANNQTNGNLQVFKNTGGATISNNAVGGNLQCKENVPAPTGGNNTVQGNKEDECAALDIPTPPPGSPGDQVCQGSLGAVTVDNLTVPANATCVLNGTQIKGNLKVETGATLNATNITIKHRVRRWGGWFTGITGQWQHSDQSERSDYHQPCTC
jgi:hypothetical protein